MTVEQVQVESQSVLPQQQDPNADLMKARPGGDTDTVVTNPGTGFRDQKPESGFEGPGSEGGYEGGAGGSAEG